MITAGVNEQTGGATSLIAPTPREGCDCSIPMSASQIDVISRVDAVEPEAMVLVVDPPAGPAGDASACRVMTGAGAPEPIYSLRFLFHLACRFGVSARALCKGQHRRTRDPLKASRGLRRILLLIGRPRAASERRLESFAATSNEVRYANISIIEGIGASQHGIGMVSARIAEIISRDERVGLRSADIRARRDRLPGVVGRERASDVNPEVDRKNARASPQCSDAKGDSRRIEEHPHDGRPEFT